MKSPHPADETIQKITQWGIRQSQVRAILLTSTPTIPGGMVDRFPDYDLILVVQDIHYFVDDHAWLDHFGKVLVAYWDEVYADPIYGIELCANVIQFTNGLKIDFTLWPIDLIKMVLASPALPAELDAGYCILLDKDHLTDALRLPKGKSYGPTPPTLTQTLTMSNDFLSDAHYVTKYLWRGELLPAKRCLDCDMQHKYLRQMLEWWVEIDHGWSIPVGYLGKGLKMHLPGGVWDDLV